MYNYDEFTPESYDFTKQTGLQVGGSLPDITLTNMKDKQIALRSLLGQTLVLETGSLTCPLYVGKIKSMNALMAKHPDVCFAVIYIREAHPGSKIPTHKDGTVLYRADWNIPDRIDAGLAAIKSGAPISNQPADFTPVAPWYSLRVLARAGGIKAVRDFLSHLPQLMRQHWKKR